MESRGHPRSTKSAKSEDLSAESRRLNTVNIMYMNAQSIVNKIDELRSLPIDLKADIILINESLRNHGQTKTYPRRISVYKGMRYQHERTELTPLREEGEASSSTIVLVWLFLKRKCHLISTKQYGLLSKHSQKHSTSI